MIRWQGNKKKMSGLAGQKYMTYWTAVIKQIENDAYLVYISQTNWSDAMGEESPIVRDYKIFDNMKEAKEWAEEQSDSFPNEEF